jgi:hypothetical protein
MNEQEHLDFVSAMSQEFIDVLSAVSDDVCGSDIYTVVSGVFSHRLSPVLFARLNAEQIEHLRLGFARYFEVDDTAITTKQLSIAISRTLARWPAEQSK